MDYGLAMWYKVIWHEGGEYKTQKTFTTQNLQNALSVWLFRSEHGCKPIIKAAQHLYNLSAEVIK